MYHARHSFGGDQLTPEGDEAELHLLEEGVHVMEEAGIASFEGATLPEIQGWVDEARLKTEGGEVAGE